MAQNDITSVIFSTLINLPEARHINLGHPENAGISTTETWKKTVHKVIGVYSLCCVKFIDSHIYFTTWPDEEPVTMTEWKFTVKDRKQNYPADLL